MCKSDGAWTRRRKHRCRLDVACDLCGLRDMRDPHVLCVLHCLTLNADMFSCVMSSVCPVWPVYAACVVIVDCRAFRFKLQARWKWLPRLVQSWPLWLVHPLCPARACAIEVCAGVLCGQCGLCSVCPVRACAIRGLCGFCVLCGLVRPLCFACLVWPRRTVQPLLPSLQTCAC